MPTTQLSPTATPGGRYSFLAKTAAAIIITIKYEFETTMEQPAFETTMEQPSFEVTE